MYPSKSVIAKEDADRRRKGLGPRRAGYIELVHRGKAKQTATEGIKQLAAELIADRKARRLAMIKQLHRGQP